MVFLLQDGYGLTLHLFRQNNKRIIKMFKQTLIQFFSSKTNFASLIAIGAGIYMGNMELISIGLVGLGLRDAVGEKRG